MIRVLKITALVSVVVLLNAITTLLFVQSAAPASAGPNCVNGDVNGDFVVDITDPIHLLGYIFEGTPVPVACAQNPSGVTAVELDFITGKYQGVPASFTVSIPETSPGATFFNSEVFVVPQGKMFVATSVHTGSFSHLNIPPIWLGKNYDFANGFPNGASVNTNDPQVFSQLVNSGLIPGSLRMGDYTLVNDAGNSRPWGSFAPRRDMVVVYEPGDSVSVFKNQFADQLSLTVNGYFLNVD